MAYCTNCSREIPALSVQCSHCGHNFLPPEKPAPGAGWEYSLLADCVLMAGAFASAMGAIACGYFACLYLCFSPHYRSDFWESFGFHSLGAVICLALLVVFLRVGNQGRNSS
jgi:hypothetical protein